MKLLFENWRGFLNEVSYDEAKKSLDSKKTKKIIKAYNFDRGEEPGKNLLGLLDVFKYNMSALVPDDIEDNQKGTALLWILGVIRDNKELRDNVLEKILDIPGSMLVQGLRRGLEKFFHYQKFMGEKDLFKIKDFGHLQAIVDRATSDIEAHQEKQQYMDVEEGTEVFRDDERWFIAAIHNKGASCSLGKGTDWCTAAPGLDYFAQYYKPEDPLFFFKDKVSDKRYQVHFGSSQFMDEQDEHVSKMAEKDLVGLIKQTDAGKKYNQTIVSYEDTIIAYGTDDPEMLEQLAAKYLNNDSEVAADIKSSVIRNTSSGDKIYQMLSDDSSISTLYHLVDESHDEPFHQAESRVPSSVLEKIAQRINNEPELRKQATRGTMKDAPSIIASLARSRGISANIIEEIIKFYITNAEEGETTPDRGTLGRFAVERLFERRGPGNTRHSPAETMMTEDQLTTLIKVAASDPNSKDLTKVILNFAFKSPDISVGEEAPWKKKYPELADKMLNIALKSPSKYIRAEVIQADYGIPEETLLKIAATGEYFYHRALVNSGAMIKFRSSKKVYEEIFKTLDAVEKGEKEYSSRTFDPNQPAFDAPTRAARERKASDWLAGRLKQTMIYRARVFAITGDHGENRDVQKYVLEKLADDKDSNIRGNALAKLREYPFGRTVGGARITESINFKRFIRDLI